MNNSIANPISAYSNAILQNVKKKMFGVDEVIRLSLVALFTGGHVLLEGNPGMGKTMLVRGLGESLGLEFKRIQFTPDLMPSDIIGTSFPVEAEGGIKFEFKKGPIFTSLLLADEINRATPKTQSAMLEAMAEKRVTPPAYETQSLPAPFMVLATQNPIEQQGTFELPEAQADRFMFKIIMPSPDALVMSQILQKEAGKVSGVLWNQSPEIDASAPLPVITFNSDAPRESKDLFETVIKKNISELLPTPAVELHITNLYLASNGQLDDLYDLKDDQAKQQVKRLARWIRYGLGPRGVANLLLGAKAYTLMFSPGIEKADGPALASVALAVLRHRLKLDFDWMETYKKTDKRLEGLPEAQLHERFLIDFFTCTAPERAGYRQSIKNCLQA